MSAWFWLSGPSTHLVPLDFHSSGSLVNAMPSTNSHSKSSIDFLLSGNDEPHNDNAGEAHRDLPDSTPVDVVCVEPRTVPATNNPKKRTIRRPRDPKLSLRLLQQPIHAKVSTHPSGRVFFSEHRPIHPPPILQLCVDDMKPRAQKETIIDELKKGLSANKDPKSIERIKELDIIKTMRSNRVPPWVHYSTFFVVAKLQATDVQEPQHQNPDTVESTNDLLIGTNVASGMPISLRINMSSQGHLGRLLPVEKLDPSNYAITFVFSDLAVKKIGKFKLSFDLYEAFNGKVVHRNSTLSDEFQIFTPKKFTGSTVSSPLTSFLFNHGARIRQRKRSSNSATKKGSSTNVDDDSSKSEDSKSEDSLENPQKLRRLSYSRDMRVPSHPHTLQHRYSLPPVDTLVEYQHQKQSEQQRNQHKQNIHQVPMPMNLPSIAQKYYPHQMNPSPTYNRPVFPARSQMVTHLPPIQDYTVQQQQRHHQQQPQQQPQPQPLYYQYAHHPQHHPHQNHQQLEPLYNVATSYQPAAIGYGNRASVEDTYMRKVDGRGIGPQKER